MPPQVKAGGGPAPVVSQPSNAVEETKSQELEKKPAEQKKDTTENKSAEPYRATPKEASQKKAEMATAATTQQIKLNQQLKEKENKTEKATSHVKPESPKTKTKESQGGAWEFVKGAAQFAADAAGAGVGALRDTTAKASAVAGQSEIRQQGVEKLAQRKYRQDMVPGAFFEVEKITPGSTDNTKTIKRVEDRGVGDQAFRDYHPEQHRTSTQSGLEDRLKEHNAGKELTPFEKGLVSEWDPQKKGGAKKNPITALTPIKGLDSTGTKGPTEVQAYKVQRGVETRYYDRNGNVVEPESRQRKVENLDRRQYKQDMVRGQFFEVEQITPGNTNKTEPREHANDLSFRDISLRKFHPWQERTSTQSGLGDRLKELNQGKELTPFEEGMVSEWDPQMKSRGGKDAITNLSPIMGVDSSGKNGPTEVQAYKVLRGDTGNRKITYYDRHGNELLHQQRGGEAIPTDGPVDYLSAAHALTKIAANTGKKIGEKIFAKDAASITKAETGAAARAAEQQVAKAETGTTARMAEHQAAKAEMNAGTKAKNVHAQEGLTARISEDQVIRKQQEKVVEDAIGQLDEAELLALRDRLHTEGVLHPGNVSPQQVDRIRRDGRGMRIPGDREGILRETREAIEKTRDPELVELLEQRRVRLGQRETTIPDELRRLREARVREKVENPGTKEIPQEDGYPTK